MAIENHLLTGEKVTYTRAMTNVGILTGSEALKAKPFSITNKTPGTFYVTNKRILHYSNILFAQKVEQINLHDINNVEMQSGLIFAVIRVQSITNVMEIDMPASEGMKITKYINEMAQWARNQNATPVQITAVESPLDKIKKLSELKTQGIITEEEFETKKAELLKQI